MKKNFVWVFLFLFIVCAGKAFTQHSIQDEGTCLDTPGIKKKTSFKQKEGYFGYDYVQVVGTRGVPDSKTGAFFFVRLDKDRQPAGYSGANPVKGDPSLIYIDRTLDNKRLSAKKFISLPDNENKKGEIPAIVTGSQQYVDICTYNDTAWYSPTSNSHLFTIQPNSEVIFKQAVHNVSLTECKYSDPNGVWKVMDTYPNADALYKKWAESYSAAVSGSKPSGKSDKDIIQSFCKFQDPNAVWKVTAKHGNEKTLLQRWADSYYK